MVKYLGIHETLDAHEILTSKNLSLTKTVMMSKLAQDPELKAILENESERSENHIQRLKQLFTNREEQQ